jgi:putative ABC transport system ATP-binding protein
VLSIRGLAKSYPGPRPRPVFAGVDLELAPGEYVAVRGESGIGKSTLLNLVAGLDRPDAGAIALDGVELAGLDDDASPSSVGAGWVSSSRPSTSCRTSTSRRTSRSRCS